MSLVGNYYKLHLSCIGYNAVLVLRLETEAPLLWLRYLPREKYSLQYSPEHNLFCLLYAGT